MKNYNLNLTNQQQLQLQQQQYSISTTSSSNSSTKSKHVKNKSKSLSIDKSNYQSQSFKIGDQVKCSNSMIGICRFIGTINSKVGVWVGIDLSNQENSPPNPWHGKGKNSGSVNGVFYFECPPLCGIFFPLSKVSLLQIESSSSINSFNVQVNQESTESFSPSFSSSYDSNFPSSSPSLHSPSDSNLTINQKINSLSSNHSTPRPKNRPSFSTPRERPTPARETSLPLNSSISQTVIPSKKQPLIRRPSNAKPNAPSRTFLDPPSSRFTSAESNNPLNLSANPQISENSLSKSTNQIKRSSVYHLPTRPSSTTSHKRAESVNSNYRPTDPPDWARASQAQRPKSRLSLASTPESRPRQNQSQTASVHRIALPQLPILQTENVELQAKLLTLQKQLEQIQLQASESDQKHLKKCSELELELERSKESLNQQEKDRLTELEETKKALTQRSQRELNSLREEISKLKENLETNQQSLTEKSSKFDLERSELQNQLHQLRSAGQSLCGVYENKISNLEELRLSQLHESELISEELKATKLALEEFQEKARLNPTDNSTNTSTSFNSSKEAVEIDNERLKADLKHTKERLSEVQDEAYQLKQELENEREVNEQQSQLREEALQQHMLSLKDVKDEKSKLQNQKSHLEFKLGQVESRLKETLETMEQERVELEGLRAEALVSLHHPHPSKSPRSQEDETQETATIVNTAGSAHSEPTMSDLSSNFRQNQLESELKEKQSRIEHLESELSRYSSLGQCMSSAQGENNHIDSNAIMDQEKMLVIQKYQRLLLIKDEENLKLINRMEELESELENNFKAKPIVSPSRGLLSHQFQSSPKLKHHTSTQSLRTTKSFQGSPVMTPMFSPNSNRNSEEMDTARELAKVTQQLVGLKLIARQSNDERAKYEKVNQGLKETIEDLKQHNRTLEQKIVQLVDAGSSGDKTEQKIKLNTPQQNRRASFQELGIEMENVLTDIGNNLNETNENRQNSHGGEVIIGDYKRVQKLECEIDQLKDKLVDLEQKHSRRVEAVQNEVIELEGIIEAKVFQEEKLENEIEELKQVIEATKQAQMSASTPRVGAGLLQSNAKLLRRQTGSPDVQSQTTLSNQTKPASNSWSNSRRTSSFDYERNRVYGSNEFEAAHIGETSLNRLQEEQEEDEDDPSREQHMGYHPEEMSQTTDWKTKIIVTDNDSSYLTQRRPNRDQSESNNCHTISNCPSSRSPISPPPLPTYLNNLHPTTLSPSERCELCDGVDHQLATCPIFCGKT